MHAHDVYVLQLLVLVWVDAGGLYLSVSTTHCDATTRLIANDLTSTYFFTVIILTANKALFLRQNSMQHFFIYLTNCHLLYWLCAYLYYYHYDYWLGVNVIDATVITVINDALLDLYWCLSYFALVVLRQPQLASTPAFHIHAIATYALVLAVAHHCHWGPGLQIWCLQFYSSLPCNLIMSMVYK